MSWRRSLAALALGALAATPAMAGPLCTSEAGLKALRNGIFDKSAQQGPDKIADEISLTVRNKEASPRKGGAQGVPAES